VLDFRPGGRAVRVRACTPGKDTWSTWFARDRPFALEGVRPARQTVERTTSRCAFPCASEVDPGQVTSSERGC